MAFKGSATNTNSALQNSVAFLQIQKNANLQRKTSSSEDVFRIFRQTGQRIALIKQQVERERCTYLKDSYTEKNQLYKELAGIFHSKRAINDRSRQSGGDSISAVSLPGLCSRVGQAGEGKNNDRDGGHFSAHKTLKELRSINVNVLKRCECCRRRAFRTIENDDDDDGVFDEEAFKCESQNPDDKTQGKAKTKVARKLSQASKTGDITKVKKEKATLVHFSRYDDVRIPAMQRVQAGIWALKKQTNGQKQSKHKTSVSFQVKGSTTSLNNAEEKATPASKPENAACATEEKAASVTPGASASTRPTLKSRASMKLESQASKSNERLHLEGNAWTSHVETVQEKKLNNSTAITGLSKAYCAFKKLLRKMEDEYNSEQFAQGEEFRAESRTEVPGSRPASNMSKTESRWLPLRRTSDSLSVRLNSWTSGSLEPACMDSFKEKGEEEGEETLSATVENKDEVFTFEQFSEPNVLHTDY